MEFDSPLLRFTLLSALTGLAVFVALHALQVWWHRNRSDAPGPPGASRLRDGLKRWCTAALVGGLFCLGLVLALREVTVREGVLAGNGLVAVRARDDGQPVDLPAGEAVIRNDVLVRFSSPQVQSEIEALRHRVARLRAENEALHAGAREVEPLQFQLREAESALAGLESRLVVTASSPGRVVYRDPSPGAVPGKGVLLVVAPEDGFRAQVRVFTSQLDALRRAGDVDLELVEAALEPRFTGRFREARPLAHDSRQSVAELDCRPPAEVVRRLAEGEPIRVRLLWRPPLVGEWLFQAGAVLAVLGAAGLVVAGWLPRRAAGQNLDAAAGHKPEARARGNHRPLAGASGLSHSAPPPATGVGTPASGGNGQTGTDTNGTAPNGYGGVYGPADLLALDLEFGQAGRLLYGLGLRLREAIHRGQVDADLLGALEWALDRHQARAVRLLVRGLGDASSLAPRLEQLLAGSATDDPEAARACVRDGRLAAILRVLSPSLVERCPGLG